MDVINSGTRVREKFSLNAETYGQHNIIQNRVVAKLVQSIPGRPRSILDLGCGSGAVYKAITWSLTNFTAVDFAPGMLSLHPEGPEIEVLAGDFNDPGFFEKMNGRKFDRIISASALQWARDLDFTFFRIREIGAPISFVIFTSGTFSEIHKAADVLPILPSAKEIEAKVNKYFTAECNIERYTLNFPSVREIFRYIKRSGVSGGRNILDYKKAKRLMLTYPHRHLEFEVLFVQT